MNATTSSIGGVAVGADYRFSPYTIAGFALAGGGTNFSLANGLGSGRSDLFQAGAFIRHAVGPAYISAALAYGWQDITTDRTVTNLLPSYAEQAIVGANSFARGRPAMLRSLQLQPNGRSQACWTPDLASVHLIT